MNRVITLPTLPRRKPAPKPITHAYETVTAEERAAADELLRKATALQRLFNASFLTGAALAQAPKLIEATREALAELEALVG